MRVVHIIKATRIGGAERHLLTLLPALRAMGIDATLIVLVEPDNPMQAMLTEAREAGVPVQSLIIRRDYDPMVIARLRTLIQQFKPDVVHTHLIHADTLALPAAKLAGVRTVISSRHAADPFRERRAIRTLNRMWWRGFTAGIAISEAIKRFTIQVEQARHEQLHVVYYGIHHQPTPPEVITQQRHDVRHDLGLPDDAILLGVVCRLVPGKGVSEALQAFQQLMVKHAKAYLLIVGDGDLRPSLEAEASECGLNGRVFFLGWRSDVPDLMAALDIFVLPSYAEGFGMVFLEAMAKRVPVVSTQVMAIPEVVHDGETGLLVPPRDSDALAHALDTLLQDPALRRHMGLLGEDRLETVFGAERMAQETIAVYEQTI